MSLRISSLIALNVLVTASVCLAQVDSNFHCYLLFGQSNMAGGGAGTPASYGGAGAGTLNAADCDTSPRVKVLAFCDCNANSNTSCKPFAQKHVADKWYTAQPPLHICAEGVSPGDWFAKTMLDSIRADIKIGLIPCALSGQALTVFVKGGSNFNIPNWAQPTLANSSPYAWMLARCKLAQQAGVIKGMLLHQGESGPSGEQWKSTAKQIFDDLKKDLGLPGTLPVVVGELRQDKYSDFNKNTVDAFASSYPNCGLASSANCGVQSDDGFHFNPEGMRELGKRYARAFLGLASQQYVPRKGTVAIEGNRTPLYKNLKSASGTVTVYTINGRSVRSYPAGITADPLRNLNARGVYLVARQFEGGRVAVVPSIK
jgi:hypothetical protein